MRSVPSSTSKELWKKDADERALKEFAAAAFFVSFFLL
jgi:hypothetical protein